jgi:hypothetical protein
MPHYRIQRTLPNGWNIRLEMLPYDTNLGGAVTTLGDVCLLELGDQVAEFDGLPYGMVKPQTLRFQLAWDMLPTAMQTYIETSVDGDKCNLWMLFSDRGTGGATYSLEFAGVEDNVEAVNLEPLDDGSYAYSVQLVDMLFHAMKTKTGYSIFNGKVGAITPPSANVFQVRMKNDPARQQFQTAIGDTKADTFNDIVGHMRTGMATHIKSNYARTTSAATDIFDWSQVLDDFLTTALELYKINSLTNTPRQIGTALTSTTAVLLTNALEPKYNGKTIGGIYSMGDNFAWGRKDVTVYDILRDLCEAMGIKASYEFTYRTTAGVDRITATWFPKRICGSKDDTTNTADTADVTLSIENALALPSIVKRGDNIGKAEVRYESTNQDDLTEIVRLKKGARSSRSMNIEPIIHNVPVILMKDYHKNSGRSDVLKQTNHIMYADTTNDLIKVHETTKYYYGPKANQWVKVSSTASEEPTAFKADFSNEPAFQVQMAALQAQTSMTAALCLLHLHVFADENNATAEMEWNYTASQYVRPQGLAGRHALTDNVADTFTALNWSQALPTSITMNWFEGTTKVKYFLLAPTTQNEVS